MVIIAVFFRAPILGHVFTHVIHSVLTNPVEVSTIIVPIVQRRELGHREVKELA